MGLAVLHPDGREVPLTGEALRHAVLLAREWVRRNPWSPWTVTEDGSEHPQHMAFTSKADIIGYGGAAGGGKTDLACGLAITQHRKVMILRRVGTELQGILDRLEELIGNSDGKNGQAKIWKRLRHDGERQQIEWASLPNAGDEKGFQGRPHDLLVFDEAANFLEGQVRFLLGWLRSTVKGQRKRALLTFNPPTSSDGRWVISFFAPWLDDKYPNPAEPGELRWFATIAGEDVEVPDDKPFVLHKELIKADHARHFDREPDDRVYDFDPKLYRGSLRVKVIRPMSRTFIPSRITDNPALLGTGYMTMLQGLPEPLRSQMLNGDFKAGMMDSEWQVIPTAWVEAAMDRWEPKTVLPEQSSLGVDVARGGEDETVIAPRYDNWYDRLKVFPGASTPDGQTVATHALLAMRDHAPIHIDVIGVGSSPYDILRERDVQVIGINVANKALGKTRAGTQGYFNLRSELWWMMRESLDPANNEGVALPPDPKLKADLTTPLWCIQGSVIKVESREEILKRLGRSVDRASALILAQLTTPKAHAIRGALTRKRRDYDPMAVHNR